MGNEIGCPSSSYEGTIFTNQVKRCCYEAYVYENKEVISAGFGGLALLAIVMAVIVAEASAN